MISASHLVPGTVYDSVAPYSVTLTDVALSAGNAYTPGIFMCGSFMMLDMIFTAAATDGLGDRPCSLSSTVGDGVLVSSSGASPRTVDKTSAVSGKLLNANISGNQSSASATGTVDFCELIAEVTARGYFCATNMLGT